MTMANLRLSITLLYGAALPPAIALLVWTCVLKLDPAYLVEADSFRLFCLLTILMLCLELGRNVLSRSLYAALIPLGLILVLLQGVVWYGFRFSGMAGVGEGEQIVEYYTARSGGFIQPPRIPLKVAALTTMPKSITLTHDGIETRIDDGKTVRRDGFVFRLAAIERAPLVAVRTVRGEPVDEAYLKLTSSGEQEDFIMFGRLPHRFYVKEVRSPESGADMFSLKVVRNKLTIVDRLVSGGESVYFDGHYVAIHPGAPWARLAVDKHQSHVLLWSGLFLTAAGLAGIAAKKRSGRE